MSACMEAQTDTAAASTVISSSSWIFRNHKDHRIRKEA